MKIDSIPISQTFKDKIMTTLNRLPDAKTLGTTIQTESLPAEKTQLEDLWRSLNESIIGKLSANKNMSQIADGLWTGLPDLMMAGIPMYFTTGKEASANQKEALSIFPLSRVLEHNPTVIVTEFGLPSARRAINTDKDSPDVAESDIDRFYMLRGDSLLTLDFFNKNIPSASIENGIKSEIHIEWVSDDFEAFVSVWPECKTATFVGKNYISGKNEVEKFALNDETGFSLVKSKLINFFEKI